MDVDLGCGRGAEGNSRFLIITVVAVAFFQAYRLVAYFPHRPGSFP
jgi:hypothetical protein